MRVIASITTTGRRIGRVVPAIQSVLAGDMKPDAVYLWLNAGPSPVAPGVHPDDVPKVLGGLGVDVGWCENYGPATKLLPAAERFPGDCIATFDDDVIYPRSWLRGLVDGTERYPGAIICYRARRASPSPYRAWPLVKRRFVAPDRALVPTGVHGIVYPPGCLRDDAFDVDALRQLSWENDDLWFAATRAMDAAVVDMGCKVRKAGIKGPRLSRKNLRGRNDRIAKRLKTRFNGQVPWQLPSIQIRG
jgi:hypothetical protein